MKRVKYECSEQSSLGGLQHRFRKACLINVVHSCLLLLLLPSEMVSLYFCLLASFPELSLTECYKDFALFRIRFTQRDKRSEKTDDNIKTTPYSRLWVGCGGICQVRWILCWMYIQDFLSLSSNVGFECDRISTEIHSTSKNSPRGLLVCFKDVGWLRNRPPPLTLQLRCADS